MNRQDDLNETRQRQLLQNFQKDGYIFFPSFLNQEEISLVNQKMQEFISKKVYDMPPDQVYYEDKSDKTTLKQLQRLFEHDPFFYDMMFGSRFEKLASILLDDKVIGKNIQYFNKPPKIGKPTPAHQDGYYIMLQPDEAVTMWMALEPVDHENGCVRYVKGSHKLGMRDHSSTKTLGFSQGIADFGTDKDLLHEIFFPTQAGDLLVHHALTIHRADGNTSTDRTRKAMGFIYYAASAEEDKAAHAAYSEKLVQEPSKKMKFESRNIMNIKSLPFLLLSAEHWLV